MSLTLLQIAQTADSLSNTVAGAASLPVQTTEPAMSLWDIVVKGGVIMIPIALLFAVGVYVFIERYVTIRKYLKSDTNFTSAIFEYIRDGKIESAKALCKRTNEPIARMIEKGIDRIGKPVKEIEESIEIAGKFEIYQLEKNIHILAVIASIAPMFGFLGTIIGVIKIFYMISLTSDVSIGSISSGLYTKMVTSAAGLIVGILAYVAYQWLNRLLNNTIHKMEFGAMNFIELLNEPSAK
jgi:biopolymer transport protein ExbB